MGTISFDFVQQIVHDLDKDGKGSLNYTEFEQGFDHLVRYNRDHSRSDSFSSDTEATSQGSPRGSTSSEYSQVAAAAAAVAQARASGEAPKKEVKDKPASRFNFADLLEQLEKDPSVMYIDAENANIAKRVDAESDKFEDEELAGLLDADQKTQVDILKNHVQRLRQSAENAKKKYKYLSRAGVTLEVENANLTTQMEEAQRKLQYARGEISQLSQSVEEYRKTIKSLQSTELNLLVQVKAMQEEERLANQRLTNEQRERHQMEETVTQLSQELNMLRSNRSLDARSQYKAKLGEMSDRLSALNVRKMQEKDNLIRQLQKENNSLKEHVIVQDEEIEALRRRIKELEDEIARLRMMGGGFARLTDQIVPEEDEQKKQQPKPRVISQPKIDLRPRNNNISNFATVRTPITNLAPIDEGANTDKKKILAKNMLQRVQAYGTITRLPKPIPTLPTPSTDLEAVSEEPDPTPSMIKMPSASQPHRRTATMTAKKMLERSVNNRTLQEKMAAINEKKEMQKHTLIQGMSRSTLSNALKDALKPSNSDDRKKIRDLEERNQDLEKQIAHLKEQQEVQRKMKEEEAERLLKRQQDIMLTADAQAEVTAYARYFNYILRDDEDLKHVLPINTETGELLIRIRDGWIIGKFLNIIMPNHIDTRVLNRSQPGVELSKELIESNLALVIESCRALGIEVGDISWQTLNESHKQPLLTISFLWRLIKAHLLAQVNLSDHPELIRLESSTLTRDDLWKMEPSRLLIAWINYHLKQAVASTHIQSCLSKQKNRNVFVIDSFTTPLVQNSLAHTLLMHQLAPVVFTPAEVTSIVDQDDLTARATHLLQSIQQFGVPEPTLFVTSETLTTPSSVNERLICAFTASLFHAKSGLTPLTQEEFKQADLIEADDMSDTREERAFRMWINSMDMKDSHERVYIHNLFGECKDGLLLLRILDHIKPGIVEWKKVEKRPINQFQRLSNCNYVIKLCGDLNMKIVNIGSQDIVSGNKKLTLALVWQLMHFHISTFLKTLSRSNDETSRMRRDSMLKAMADVNDKDNDDLIVTWANQRVNTWTDLHRQLQQSHLRGTPFEYAFEPLKSFNDPNLSNSLFFLHLLWSIEPNVVDWKNVTKGASVEDKLANARYTITIARKLGATIFVLPEDIVDVKSKMITILLASFLSIDHRFKDLRINQI